MAYLKITFEQLEKIVNGLKNKISAHTHDVVSTTKAGFAPKGTGTATKYLRDDGTWATPPDTKYTHPTTSGNKHIPSGGSAGQILRWSADGTAQWGADNNTTYDVVSTTANGLVPKRDGSADSVLRGDGTWGVPKKANTLCNTGVSVVEETDASWISSAINKLPTLGSGRYYETGNIVFGGYGGPVVNIAIDGDFYGAQGQKKVAYNDVATQSAAGLMSAADKKIINCFRLGNGAQGTDSKMDFVLPGGFKKTFMSADATDYIYIYPHNSFIVAFDGAGEDYEFNKDGATFQHPLIVNGKVTSSGSDYAKYYEWLDGNTENEDRRGLFVTLDGEKIKIANAEDDFILGVVSAAPGFVENAYEKEWQGKYLKDIYGERITQEVEVPESVDDEGNTIPATIKTEYVLNPEYNEDEKYIPRSQRSEWTYVGLTGELVVRDDGTCKVNGYCKPSEGGIATEAVTSCGYRVLARLDDTHIKILIK